jgi:putative 4-mercaptohistidine N1-methyltranferase
VSSPNIYETPRLLEEYLLFHYAKEQEIFPVDGPAYPAGMREALGFCQRTVGHFSKIPVVRGLDLGCAVGASTFAMAQHCEQLIGIDFSQAFIDAALALQQGNTIRYRRHEEAHVFTELTAALGDSSLRDRCTFEQGDAMSLRADLGVFDRVHAANLLCRLPRPQDLLGRLPELVRVGGELVIATPCTWLEEFTPPGEWPEADTFSWLKNHLLPSFDLTWQGHEPFLIRETARKFQWSSALVTVWRRL